jgi:hypothetical protein
MIAAIFEQCLVETEQSLGPRFAGSRHEGLQYEA